MDGKSNQVKVFVVCLVTAAFIWLMDAINTGVHTIKINYPVRFAYDDSLYFPQGELPTAVAINVSGKGWGLLSRYLKSFSDSPVFYTVSNPLKATRIDSIKLKERISERFEGLNVQFSGHQWEDRLKFDVKTYKVVPLKIDSAGIDIAPGYAITSFVNMTPSLLSVEGPASIVKQFPDSVVVRIPETGVRANYESDLRLDIPRTPALKLSHESVYVSFEVSQI